MALDANALAPAVADSLVGKLGFLSTSLFGKVGRAATAPLRQRAHGIPVSWAAIRAALLFFTNLLANIPHRQQRMTPPPARYLIYTDASLLGIAAVLVDRISGTIKIARAWITDSMATTHGLDRDTIAHWEALATNAALATFAVELRDRNAVLFIDNTHVASNLINGYSNQPELAPLMHDFWLLAARINVSIWIEYVATKANLADPPSRLPFPRCVEAWPDEDISVLAPQASLVALVLPPRRPDTHSTNTRLP